MLLSRLRTFSTAWQMKNREESTNDSCSRKTCTCSNKPFVMKTLHLPSQFSRLFGFFFGVHLFRRQIPDVFGFVAPPQQACVLLDAIAAAIRSTSGIVRSHQKSRQKTSRIAAYEQRKGLCKDGSSHLMRNVCKKLQEHGNLFVAMCTTRMHIKKERKIFNSIPSHTSSNTYRRWFNIAVTSTRSSTSSGARSATSSSTPHTAHL